MELITIGYGWEYSNISGWGVVASGSINENTKMLANINGGEVVSLSNTFAFMNFKKAPEISDSIKYMNSTFYNCVNLLEAPVIPYGVVTMNSTFEDCSKMTEAPVIPSTVLSLNSTFYNCSSLIKAPIIPSSVINMVGTFYNCISLVNAPVIPDGVTNMEYTFNGCTNLTGIVEINANPINYKSVFYNTEKQIILKGSSSILNELAATANNGNVICYISETWEEISEIVKAGNAANYWSIGDRIIVKVNGVDKEVAIAGIDHDGENTVTFVFTESVDIAKMNEEATNSGSWSNSKMRNTTMTNILNQMENKDYIIEVEKKTIKGPDDGNIDDTTYELITTSDKLFLLSYTEVFGDSKNEGQQYEYFKTESNKIVEPDEMGNSSWWWLRTPYEDNEYIVGFWGVYSSMEYVYSEPDFANSTGRVVPAFVIG